MAAYATQWILLFAVAYGQLMGSVSCCCLSRSVGASLASSFASGDEPILAASKPRTCPKCVAAEKEKHRISRAAAKSHKGSERRLTDSNKCHCSKVSLLASTQKRLAKTDEKSSFVWNPSTSEIRILVVDLHAVAPVYETPPPLGGRSWQSLSSIWKN